MRGVRGTSQILLISKWPPKFKMTAKSINSIMWINTCDEIEMYIIIIIIFYFVVIFNSHIKTFKFDVHRRHHHHLF